MKITESLKIIKKIVADPSKSDEHDALMVATTYAGQCHIVNERLRKCSSLIKNNMLPQALEEAGYDPHLIDLCNEMNGSAQVAWRKLCREKGWSVPEDLNMDAFREIMQAFSMESAIEPLLKELRRANNQGHVGQCVVILREIIRKDPGNPEWKSDLAEFETTYLEQIRRDLESFKEENDLNGVARLLVEMKQPWTIPVDSVPVEEMERFIESQHKEGLNQEEEEIVGRVRIAFQSGNVETLGDAISAYENLEKNRYFHPDPALHVIYTNARHWYQQQIKKQEMEKSYEEKLEQLHYNIAHGLHDGIKELWEEIQRFPLPVPEELEPDVQRLLSKEAEVKRRRQRKKHMGYVMILLSAMVCIFLAATWNFYRQVKNRLMTELNSAVVSENLVQCNEVIEDMVARKIAFINIPLFSSKEIGRERNRSKELALLLERKRATFKVLITELEALKEEDFPRSLEEIEGKMKELLKVSNAVTPRNTARLQLVQAAWEERKRVLRALEERDLTALFEKITSQFKTILPAANQEETDGNEKIFKQIEEFIAQGMKLSSVSAIMKKTLETFKKELESQRETMSVRTGQLMEISGAASLDEYIRALKSFSGAFPGDVITKSIQPTVEMEKIYNYLLAVPSIDFSDTSQEDNLAETSDQSSSNTDPQKNIDTANPFWYSTYEALKGLNNNIAIHKDEVKEELQKMERTPRFVDLWECTVNRPNFEPETWYFNGKPALEFINGVKGYAGIAYILSPDDLQPQFRANSAITVQVEGLRKMGHCDVIQQMLNNISYEISIESIMKEIRTIYNQPFSPILKLHLISFLTDQIFTLVGKDNALPFIEMAKDFKRFNNQVNWLCTAHSRYMAESRQAQAILTHHLQRPDRMNELTAQWIVRKRAMRRIPKWVGFADLKEPDKLHFKTGKIPDEVWVVRTGESRKAGEKGVAGESVADPLIFITEEKHMGERVRHLDHRGYLPGEALFAPYDNNTTRELLTFIMEETGMEKIGAERPVNIEWPVSWPVNIRRADFQIGRK